MDKFDYEAPDTPDEAIRSVAAEISGGNPAPLTDEERFRRQIDIEIWQEEQRWLAEERRIARERKQAEETEAARREAAAVAAQAQRERAEEIARQSRERALTDLHLRSAQQESWRRGIENAARNSAVQQQRMAQFQRALSALDARINPPAEPELIGKTTVRRILRCLKGRRD